MSAAGRPERRRRSSLAGSHPAYPQPAPSPAAAEKPQPRNHLEVAAPSGAATRTHAHATPTPPATAPDEAPARRAGSRAEQMARKTTRDAAWGWAAAARKADRRLATLVDELAHARDLGTLPGVLAEFIREAAERAGIEPHDMPAEVWQAAGIEPHERNP